MRCFGSCFCLPDDERKKKLKSPSSSISSRNARRSSYRPLASFLEEENDDPEVVGNLRGSSLTRKKVRFNLNVQAYEPIPCGDSDSVESDAEEIVGQEHCKETTPIITALTEGSPYPSNYRYQNCRYSSDEEDDDGFICDDSDLEFEHDEDDCFGDYETCGVSHQLDWRSRKDDALTRLDSVRSTLEERERSSLAKLPEEKKIIDPLQPLGTSTNAREPCTATRSSENARLRNHYVHSVLNPVENTMQWKTVKARATLPNRNPRKENVESERDLEVPLTLSKALERAVTPCKSNSPEQHAPVNASLSSWLVPVEH